MTGSTVLAGDAGNHNPVNITNQIANYTKKNKYNISVF